MSVFSPAGTLLAQSSIDTPKTLLKRESMGEILLPRRNFLRTVTAAGMASALPVFASQPSQPFPGGQVKEEALPRQRMHLRATPSSLPSAASVIPISTA